jgi:hypothetical protein
MYNSIKKKTCKEDGCNKFPQIGLNGWCFAHCPEEIKSKFKSKKDLQIKSANARRYASTKLRMAKYQENAELKNWFRFHMLNSKMECENCGADLSHYNDNDWKGSQDHIIEKSVKNGCPSIATVLENHCVLGKWCGCHGQKHTSNLNLSKMKIFPELKRRFELFKDKIIEVEKHKIPECFLN